MSIQVSRAGWILTGTGIAAVAAVYRFVEAVPQWPQYHDFADQRGYFGIPNAHNVLSNLGFLLVGAWGLMLVFGRRRQAAAGGLRAAYGVFFMGLVLTALGSGGYHIRPDNHSLVWDRLGMTVMFMGFFTSVIGELAGRRLARRCLVPLLAAGVSSVLWWAWTESAGAGDLRAYALAQFLPLLLVALMLILYRAPREYGAYIVAMLVLYGFARLCEYFDAGIYRATGQVGGHALKHLLGAAATAAVPLMLRRRLTGS